MLSLKAHYQPAAEHNRSPHHRRKSLTPKSGAYLGIACLTAIAAVGSMFELSSGDPDWGTAPTAVILALSIPSGILAFMAAVKDARANM